MLSKSQILKQRLGAITEAVFKQGDQYKVRTTVSVPKSVINAFVSKAKKEHGVDVKENWSEMELAEMMVNYITASFLNIDSIPVESIIGENSEDKMTEVTVTAPASNVTNVISEPIEPAIKQTTTPGPEASIEK